MSNLTEAAAGNGAGSGRYALVGYGFRMPRGIYTAGDFWQLLSRRGFIREPAAGRYGPGYEPVLEDAGPNRFAASYEGLMRGDEPYMFGCRLFGISTREASVMDPQMRMLLTCTWEALEQAGWDHAGGKASTPRWACRCSRRTCASRTTPRCCRSWPAVSTRASSC
jgi:acyl transferase domain-containing protein